MRIMHHVGVSAGSAAQAELEALGLTFESPPTGLIATTQIAEADPIWKLAERIVTRHRLLNMSYTLFTDEEKSAAPWCALQGSFMRGYPEPKPDEFGYRDVVYDLSNWCLTCGICARQKGDFVMKCEPNWRRNNVLQLNWVFGEFFVRPELHRAVFAPIGIPSRQVLDKKGRPLETVVQLVIDEVSELRDPALPTERCPDCGHQKLTPAVIGWFPEWNRRPKSPVVRTQWFGSGASAFRRVVVSREVRTALVNAKAKGVDFLAHAALSHRVRCPSALRSSKSQRDSRPRSTSLSSKSSNTLSTSSPPLAASSASRAASSTGTPCPEKAPSCPAAASRRPEIIA